MSKKETLKTGRLSELVSSAAHDRLKNLSTVVNATRCAILRGVNQKQIFFAQKLSDFGPVLNKLMQLKRVTDGA